MTTNSTKLWAIIKPGDGIVAMIHPEIGAIPMVTMSEPNRDMFIESAQKIATATNSILEVREYDVHTVLRELQP